MTHACRSAHAPCRQMAVMSVTPIFAAGTMTTACVRSSAGPVVPGMPIDLTQNCIVLKRVVSYL